MYCLIIYHREYIEATEKWYKLDLDKKELSDFFGLVIDSTGIKFTNRWECLKYKNFFMMVDIFYAFYRNIL